MRRLGFIISSVFFLSFLSGGLFLFYTLKNIPDLDTFDNRKISQSSKIYNRSGEVLLYEIHGEEKRTIIPFSEIPDLAKKATIAIEDSDFYIHPAFDWKSIIRAIIINLKNRELAQGGSTITQQLAKNAFLSSEKTFIRKFKELILSFKLEKKYSKDQILEFYLNQIPYGANSYGIEAASQSFFGKSAKNLSLGEVAILASTPKAPSYYSPWGAHEEELFKRKSSVLDKMLALNYISEEEYQKAKSQKIKFLPQTTSIKAPHFVMTVLDYLNSEYGEDITKTGGLKVITTLDWDAQQLAEKVVLEGAERNDELYEGRNASLVLEDATTGQILALVGSRDYFDESVDGNFNVATQGLRQPGSTFKPFAYVAAFKKGYTPDTVIFDLETEFNATDNEEKSYKPQNFDEIFRGPVKLKDALAQSINVPAVKTLYLAGLDNVLKIAKDFGIETLTERSRYGLSLVLGGGEVKLIDLIKAYSVFSQEGIKRKQSFVLRLEDSSGNILEEHQNSSSSVIEAEYVRQINNILSDTELRSPLFHNSLDLTLVPDHEIALKTGTTNDYRDAWTIGYTPSYVIGVWAGNSDNTPMVKKGSSILAAVPIWSAFAKEFLKDKPSEVFTKPEPVFREKPIMNGFFVINNQVHDILYYVNKNDPLGPLPYFPESDSQFKNWEDPVLKWLETHPIASLEQNNPSSGPIQSIVIENPANGSFIGVNPINLLVKIFSTEEIGNVDVYFNNVLINKNNQTTLSKNSSEYSFSSVFTPPAIKLQNILKVVVLDVKNSSSQKEIIVFK